MEMETSESNNSKTAEVLDDQCEEVRVPRNTCKSGMGYGIEPLRLHKIEDDSSLGI